MTQRIYVGNLPFSATEAEIAALFSEYGEVASVALPTDRESGQARGFGFVEMSDADAASAIRGLSGREYEGRSLTVNEAKERGDGGRSRSR